MHAQLLEIGLRYYPTCTHRLIENGQIKVLLRMIMEDIVLDGAFEYEEIQDLKIIGQLLHHYP